jgi:hypothetical protein
MRSLPASSPHSNLAFGTILPVNSIEAESKAALF